jgi:hypothetical protein
VQTRERQIRLRRDAGRVQHPEFALDRHTARGLEQCRLAYARLTSEHKRTPATGQAAEQFRQHLHLSVAADHPCRHGKQNIVTARTIKMCDEASAALNRHPTDATESPVTL